MATGSETGGPNVPFKSAFGPDCRFEGTALADGITLDLDKDAPTRDSLEAGTDGWDFSTTEGTHSLYKQIREGEWLECEVPDEYDATGRGDWQPHTAADIAEGPNSSSCADARDLPGRRCSPAGRLVTSMKHSKLAALTATPLLLMILAACGSDDSSGRN